MFAVLDLLEMKRSVGWNILGGNLGLERVISSVAIIDTNRSAVCTRSGELLVFVDDKYGYFDESMVDQHYVEFAERDCASIVISDWFFSLENQDQVVALANNYRIPLLYVPMDVDPLAALLDLMNTINYLRMTSFEKKYNSYRKLAEILLQSGNFYEIAALLGNEISASIIVSNADWSTLALFAHPDMTDDFPKLLKENLNSETLVEKHLCPVGAISANITVVDKCRYMRTVYSLKVGEEVFGYLTIWGRCIHVTDIENIPVLQAVKLIALECKRNERIFQESMYQKELFFDDLLSGRCTLSSKFREQCFTYGIDYHKNYHCLIICSVESITDQSFAVKATFNAMTLTNDVAVFLQRRYSNIIAISHNHKTVLLMPQGRKFENETKGKEKSISFIQDLRLYFSKVKPELQLSMAMGPCVQAEHIDRSYSGACQAFSYGAKKYKDQEFVIRYEECEVECILAKIDPEELTKLYNELIGPLKRYDPDKKMDLVESLRAYFQCNFNITDAAKMVYVHRNTFVYRMSRVMELLNLDINNRNDMVKLEIALRVEDIVLGLEK